MKNFAESDFCVETHKRCSHKPASLLPHGSFRSAIKTLQTIVMLRQNKFIFLRRHDIAAYSVNDKANANTLFWAE